MSSTTSTAPQPSPQADIAISEIFEILKYIPFFTILTLLAVDTSWQGRCATVLCFAVDTYLHSIIRQGGKSKAQGQEPTQPHLVPRPQPQQCEANITTPDFLKYIPVFTAFILLVTNTCWRGIYFTVLCFGVDTYIHSNLRQGHNSNTQDQTATQPRHIPEPTTVPEPRIPIGENIVEEQVLAARHTRRRWTMGRRFLEAERDIASEMGAYDGEDVLCLMVDMLVLEGVGIHDATVDRGSVV